MCIITLVELLWEIYFKLIQGSIEKTDGKAKMLAKSYIVCPNNNKIIF